MNVSYTLRTCALSKPSYIRTEDRSKRVFSVTVIMIKVEQLMKYILIKEAPRALQRLGLDTSEMGGFVQ